jgi:hypothetical protein
VRILSQVRQQLRQVSGRVIKRRKPLPPPQQPNQKQLVHSLGKLSDAKLCERTGELLAFYGLRRRDK